MAIFNSYVSLPEGIWKCSSPRTFIPRFFRIRDSHLFWDSTAAAKVQLLPLAFCRPGWTLDYWLLFPGAYPVRQTQIWRQVVSWLSEVGCPILKPGRLQWQGWERVANLKWTQIPSIGRNLCNPTKAAHNTSKYMQCTISPCGDESPFPKHGCFWTGATWSHSRAEEMMFGTVPSASHLWHLKILYRCNRHRVLLRNNIYEFR